MATDMLCADVTVTSAPEGNPRHGSNSSANVPTTLTDFSNVYSKYFIIKKMLHV